MMRIAASRNALFHRCLASKRDAKKEDLVSRRKKEKREYENVDERGEEARGL